MSACLDGGLKNPKDSEHRIFGSGQGSAEGEGAVGPRSGCRVLVLGFYPSLKRLPKRGKRRSQWWLHSSHDKSRRLEAGDCRPFVARGTSFPRPHGVTNRLTRSNRMFWQDGFSSSHERVRERERDRDKAVPLVGFPSSRHPPSCHEGDSES